MKIWGKPGWRFCGKLGHWRGSHEYRELHRQNAGQQKRSQRRARDRTDDASRPIPARARFQPRPFLHAGQHDLRGLRAALSWPRRHITRFAQHDGSRLTD